LLGGIRRRWPLKRLTGGAREGRCGEIVETAVAMGGGHGRRGWRLMRLSRREQRETPKGRRGLSRNQKNYSKWERLAV